MHFDAIVVDQTRVSELAFKFEANPALPLPLLFSSNGIDLTSDSVAWF